MSKSYRKKKIYRRLRDESLNQTPEKSVANKKTREKHSAVH